MAAGSELFDVRPDAFLEDVVTEEQDERIVADEILGDLDAVRYS